VIFRLKGEHKREYLDQDKPRAYTSKDGKEKEEPVEMIKYSGDSYGHRGQYCASQSNRSCAVMLQIENKIMGAKS
jgi:hypothetical protein